MAALFVPPSPQMSLTMPSRRPPLANVPNATNSPHRVGLVPSKRSRGVPAQIDIPCGQPPPKKQLLDPLGQGTRSPGRSARTTVIGGTDSTLFSRRSGNANPSAFERKLVAARDRDVQQQQQHQQKAQRHERASAETLDTIRQWQRHYRKAFPQFVFYFDNIVEDVRNKCSKQVTALGAHEEKFFSRLVTHVITTRPIPPETSTQDPPRSHLASSADPNSANGAIQTVNPSLLEKGLDCHPDGPFKTNVRRELQSTDVLHRAREMGMKIWALEKLQRMIATINDGEISGYNGHSARSHNMAGGNARARDEQDLSQVLKNELLNGPSDREPLPSMKEMVIFKGYFIYVHDMDEKTRPVMVREYPKVARRQDGAWPQFRSAPLGKCPFIEEEPPKKLPERHNGRREEADKPAVDERLDRDHQQKPSQVVGTAATGRPANDQVQKGHASKDLRETEHNQTRQVDMQLARAVARQISPRKSSESFIPPQFPRTGSFYIGREPAASGVQPSNITSAIRSQMISSTAAAPGAKAGVSKEVHELKRKVLEKGNTGIRAAGTRTTTDSSAVLKTSRNQGTRMSKTKTQEKSLCQDKGTAATQTDGSRDPTQRPDSQAAKKKQKKRDPKPGYCENCRDKFDDFDEHVTTRKHRKFALANSNWESLDFLLDQLERPLKPIPSRDYSDSD